MEIQQVSARGGSWRGVWATGIVYNYGDIVQDGVNGAYTNNIYVCATANTSGVWATDLANGDWVLVISVATLQPPGSFLPLSGGTINGILNVNGPFRVVYAGSSQGYFASTGSQDSNVYIDNQAGGKASQVVFEDAGTAKWTLTKQDDNSFTLGDVAGTKQFLTAVSGGALTLGAAQNFAIDQSGNATTLTQTNGNNSARIATTAYADAKSLHGDVKTVGTTWTSPSYITSNTIFKITLVGGGGGSGGANPNGIGGAGAGGTCVAYVTGLSPSTGYSYSIGAGGNSGGGSGGNTSITIGATTYTANGGVGSGGSAAPGAGGTCTNGTYNIQGQSGQNGNGSGAAPNYAYGGSTFFGGGGSYTYGPTGYGSGAGGGSGVAGQPGMILIEWVA